ncbi:MAG: KAP family P-loop NTPase fold protein [Candidatus Adiutrix sp.]
METGKSCVNDRPLLDKEADFLGNYKYAQGLINFIMKADTPITIAIQGGWGSGKTSLINMLKAGIESPENQEFGKAVCVIVNAWEHSLFMHGGDRHNIANDLLGGLIDEIEKAIEDIGDLDDEVKDKALGEESGLGKAWRIASNVGMLALRAAAKAATGAELPEDAANPLAEPSKMNVVSDLKQSMRTAISTITKESSNYKRFVCFVDDLDRVHPETAIEILDTFKNIFDIENCIFVLAIDYDIVVKGLKNKFGEKTADNEREFRQYFDKIIQIPFTMPIGSYKEHLPSFITEFLAPLGYHQDNPYNPQLLSTISDVAFWATDGVPRGIKRIINTMAVLMSIEQINQSPPKVLGNFSKDHDLALTFIVVSLHINFPEICRKLMSAPDFPAWSFERYKTRWELDEKVYAAIPEQDEEKLFDEEYKRVLYCLCATSPWLKSKADSVFRILMALRELLRKYGSSSEGGTLGEAALSRLNDALKLVRIVSVDIQPALTYDDSSVKTDRITMFFRQVHIALNPLSWLALPDNSGEMWARKLKSKYRSYTVEPGYALLASISFFWDPDVDSISLIVEPKAPKGQDEEQWGPLLAQKLKTHGLKFTLENKSLYFSQAGFAGNEDFDFAQKGEQLSSFFKNTLLAVKNASEEVV